MRFLTTTTIVAALAVASCTSDETESAREVTDAGVRAAETAEDAAAVAALQGQAAAIFGELPGEVDNLANPITAAKIELGRQLYYEKRLSKNQEIACNTCHQLDAFGVDGEATSPGHRGQRGGRNSPTVYNAALHIAQFWDGREPDVEAQAKGPILNPIEMAMPSEAATIEVIRSIPGYAPLFEAAFPEEVDPVTYDNLARAIGAFERRLMTPGPLDRFIAGDASALDARQRAGLGDFIQTGCITCHNGPAVGGGTYQKLGLIEPYETKDTGREAVTGNPADRYVFKVPGLRNITRTGPWFHDGSITSLDEAVRLMAKHQLGRQLDKPTVGRIKAFLGALTGEVDAHYVAEPDPLPGSPTTPAPDPT